MNEPPPNQHVDPDHVSGGRVQNKSGVCLLCNDTLGAYDSKYLGEDGTLICTAHRVKDWQARGIDFKTYQYWTDG